MAEVTPQQAAQLLERGEIQLIDVRERAEYDAGRIAGSRLIELGGLTAAADSIDPRQTVVFVCRSGVRSAMATEAFASAGYDARNLEGGMQAWQAAGLPMDPVDGRVA